jgi:hypothetical protein
MMERSESLPINTLTSTSAFHFFHAHPSMIDGGLLNAASWNNGVME